VKEATFPSFIYLTKRAIETKDSNVQTKTIEVDVKLLAKENRIMFAELTIMEPK
jgi:hypothetical protein